MHGSRTQDLRIGFRDLAHGLPRDIPPCQARHIMLPSSHES